MDKKIVDKGWVAMRQTLDREMPERRRRRIVWWWFGLLLIPVAGFGGWWWAEKNALPKTPAPPSEPMAQRVSPLKAAPSSPDVPTTASATPDRARADVAAAANARSASNFPTEKKPLCSAVLNPSESPATAASPNAELPSANAANPTIFVDSEARLAAFEPFSTLPILSQNLENQIEKSFSLWALLLQGKSISVTKVKRAPWAFGALAAVGTERFSALNSLSVGGVADWEARKKWGLRAGLAYNNYRASEGAQIVAVLDANDYAAAVNGNFEALDSLGNQVTEAYNISVTPSSQVAVPVSALHRVEVSMSAFWKPARQVRLYGGASVAYLAGLKSEANVYAGNYSLSLNEQSAAKAANELVSNEIRRWQTEAQVGLGWQVSKRFELGIFYRQPFSAGGKSAQSYSLDLNTAGSPSPNIDSEANERATRRGRVPWLNLQGVLFF
jgi:hypothetical protein